MSAPRRAKPLLLLADDEAANLQLLRHILQDDYALLFAKDGARALALAQQERPALILLDVMMPGMSGHDACRRLKAEPLTAAIPVIFVTALNDMRDELSGFEAGAVDYLTKPLSPAIVRARVRTHLSLVRIDELKETRLQIVQRLGLAAEYKDNETGLHVIRMSHYVRLRGVAAGMDAAGADDLLHAAPMHDVGKIGIPAASCKSLASSMRTNGPSCRRMRASAARSSANTPPAACWRWRARSPCRTMKSGMVAATRTAWPA